MCVEAGAEFALSSDAHAPDQVGFAYERALEFLAGLWTASASSRAASGAASRWASLPIRRRPRPAEASSGGQGRDRLRLPSPGRGRVADPGRVEIEHEQGLEGYSDADVLTHAVIDALLGSCGLGDLGRCLRPRRSAGATPTR